MMAFPDRLPYPLAFAAFMFEQMDLLLQRFNVVRLLVAAMLQILDYLFKAYDLWGMIQRQRADCNDRCAPVSSKDSMYTARLCLNAACASAFFFLRAARSVTRDFPSSSSSLVAVAFGIGFE
jgi:hypothetical protein